MVVCKCLFLNGREVDIVVDRNATGKHLLDSVCDYLGLAGDRKAFGVVHRGGGKKHSAYNWWVNLDKPLRKQIPGKCQIWAFAFVVKFYPINLPRGLDEETARYHVVLQVRQDLLAGRLQCQTHTRALLAAYWLQSEHGNWVSDVIDSQLAEEFRYIRTGVYADKEEQKSTGGDDIDFEKQMFELHRCLKDMSPEEADRKFLKLSSSLPTYGIHFYPVRELTDKRGRAILGCGPTGITVVVKRRRKSIKWALIRAISFKHNIVTIKLAKGGDDGDGSETSAAGADDFAFDDTDAAKIFWRAAIDHHVHFRVRRDDDSGPDVGVTLKRKWSMLGKKRAKPSKAVAAALVKRPQLAAILEGGAAKKPSSRSVSATGDGDDESVAREMLLPLSSARSDDGRRPSARSSSSSAIACPPPPPPPPVAAVGFKKRAVKSDIVTSSAPDAGAVGGILVRHRSNVSCTKTEPTQRQQQQCDDLSSEVTDNTDVLCSADIVDKTFSYAEHDGVNSINSWLELSAPAPPPRGRPITRALHPAPTKSPTSKSPRDDAGGRYVGGASKPIVIRATQLRELSPLNKIRYEREPTRRQPVRFRSADNLPHKARLALREERDEKAPISGHFADIYKREYLDNVGPSRASERQRRARSMYSLDAPGLRRDRSSSRDRSRHASPGSLSAIASSLGSRPSCDDFASGFLYEDDYGEPYPLLSFAQRVRSELRLNRAAAAARDNSVAADNPPSASMRNIDQTTRERRRNITSWTQGDADDEASPRSYLDYQNYSSRETIPQIPPFLRSVR